MTDNNKLYIGIGIGIAIVVIIALIPFTAKSDDVYFVNTGSGGSSGGIQDCINVGSGRLIIQNTTNQICNIRSLVAGNGISITNGTTTITITNDLPESTVCTNLGSIGEGIYATGNCDFKKLVAGNGISLSSNGTRITITNSSPDDTTCANVGSGSQIYKDGECNFRTLITNNGIIATQNTNDITLTPKYELLCQNTLASSASSLSCSNFTSRKQLMIISTIKSTGGTGVEPYMQFNSDNGNNYSWRVSVNGGADTTLTSTNGCAFFGAGGLLVSNDAIISEQIIYNNLASERKLVAMDLGGQGITTGANVVLGRSEGACKWDNTTNQITTISLVKKSGTGNFNTGTELTIWGFD